MRNIIKIHAWAEPYVNFLYGETSPLKHHSVSQLYTPVGLIVHESIHDAKTSAFDFE